MYQRISLLLSLLLAGMLLFNGCKEENMEPDCVYQPLANSRYFEFEASDGLKFVAWTNRMEVIDKIEEQLALAPADRNMHINGKILEVPANCSLNYSWSWYFDPTDWDLAEISIEVCDGNPQYVEENLGDYIDIGRYCPWSSKVTREISAPF